MKYVRASLPACLLAFSFTFLLTFLAVAPRAGHAGEMLIDPDWRRSVAERQVRIARGEKVPGPVYAPGDITRVGQVLVMEGDDRTVARDMAGNLGIDVAQLQQISRNVIAYAGDVFDGITVWIT